MKINHLSASAGGRWFNCPGSVRAAMVAPPIEGEGTAADEGTAAHKLFETCLRKNLEAETYLDEEISVSKAKAKFWVVDEEMVEHIQAGVDLVHAKRGKGHLWLESEILLKTKPIPVRGTLDSGWYGKYPEGKKSEWQLHVLDLKYGYNSVEVGGNVQLKIYGLGRLKELLRLKKPVDSVHLWIYQPRSIHADGPFRHIKMTVKEMLEFEKELNEKVKAVDSGALHAGPWCLHCGAHPTCRESERAAMRIVRTKYHADDTGRIGELFLQIPFIKGWIKTIQDLAETMAHNGTVPEGLKVVEGRKSRRWPGGGKSEAEQRAQMKDIMTKLRRAFQLSEDDIAPRKLNSVARIEKRLDKDEKHRLEKFYFVTRGKEKLVPIDDSRYAITADLYFDKEDSDDGLVE